MTTLFSMRASAANRDADRISIDAALAGIVTAIPDADLATTILDAAFVEKKLDADLMTKRIAAKRLDDATRAAKILDIKIIRLQTRLIQAERLICRLERRVLCRDEIQELFISHIIYLFRSNSNPTKKYKVWLQKLIKIGDLIGRSEITEVDKVECRM